MVDQGLLKEVSSWELDFWFQGEIKTKVSTTKSRLEVSRFFKNAKMAITSANLLGNRLSNTTILWCTNKIVDSYNMEASTKICDTL